MKRKMLIFLLIAVTAIATTLLSGCGDDTDKPDNKATATPTAAATSAPTEAVTTPGGSTESTPTPTPTPTPAQERFPDRANADTGNGKARELRVGDVAPEFSITLYDGTTFRMSEHDDEVVLLNFWATWCGPCVGEMPDLARLAAEEIPGFTLRMISTGDEDSDVKQFIREYGYDKAIVGCADGTRIAEYYPCDYIPYTVIVKNGVVAETVIGSNDYSYYRQLIDKALSE